MKERVLRWLSTDPFSNAWAKLPVPLRRFVIYPSFFFACFFAFCYWTFPYERVRAFVVQKVEYEEAPGGALRPSGYRLAIINLEPSFVTGIDLTGVRLRKAAEGDERPLDLVIPSASARVSLLSLLFGAPSVSFAAELGGGSLDGSVTVEGDALRALELNLDTIPLRALGAYAVVMGLPLNGALSGNIDLDLPEDPQQSAGSISLDVAKLQLGVEGSKLELPRMSDGLTIDPINAGDVKLRVTVDQGVGTVDELSAAGPHLALESAGTLHFATPLALTRLDLLVALNFKDEYKKSSPRTQALFTLLEGNPLVRGARTTDGKYQLRVRGSLGGGLNGAPAGRERMP